MMKRVAAVAAISLAAMQVLAGFTGVASAAGKKLGLQNHTAATATSCVVAAGIAVVQTQSTTVPASIWTDGTYLYCNFDADAQSDFGTGLDPKIADISSVIIYSNNGVVINMESGDVNGPLSNRTASYAGLKVTVDAATSLKFDAYGLPSPYGATITATDTTFAGQGLVGTIYSASSLDFRGGGGTDNLDASAVSGDVTAYGYAGNDTLKSGSGDDTLVAGDGADKLYAGAGYDTADCSEGDLFNDQCWAGAGDDKVYLGTMSDTVVGMDVAAPGDGYDVVQGTTDFYSVTYADSTVAVEFDGEAVYSETGDDTFSWSTDATTGIYSFTGSPKGDLLYGFNRLNGGAGSDVVVGTDGNDKLYGGGGKDKIRALEGDDLISGDSGSDTVRGGPGDDKIYGGGGDDVLYGLGGVDFLKGGTGIDQTWGGSGIDTCSGEVRDSCEFRKG